MEDSTILSLLWRRTENAIEALSRKYGLRLYQTALNLIGLQQDAEEVVNDTYLAVWNAIPPKQPDPLSGFVYKTGRNLALNRRRSLSAEKRRRDYEVSLSELEACIAGPDLWQQLDARALGKAIDAFLDTVSPDSRVIFLRRYWFGDGVKDIARAFGMTSNAVSVRLSRTRDQLKEHLIKEGFYEREAE